MKKLRAPRPRPRTREEERVFIAEETGTWLKAQGLDTVPPARYVPRRRMQPEPVRVFERLLSGSSR